MRPIRANHSTSAVRARLRSSQCEPLEARTMLAANLTVDILTSLPSELVGGTKQKVQVAVANEGDAPAVGAQNLRFYLSTDAQWSAGDRKSVV